MDRAMPTPATPDSKLMSHPRRRCAQHAERLAMVQVRQGLSEGEAALASFMARAKIRWASATPCSAREDARAARRGAPRDGAAAGRPDFQPMEGQSVRGQDQRVVGKASKRGMDPR